MFGSIYRDYLTRSLSGGLQWIPYTGYSGMFSGPIDLEGQIRSESAVVPSVDRNEIFEAINRHMEARVMAHGENEYREMRGQPIHASFVQSKLSAEQCRQLLNDKVGMLENWGLAQIMSPHGDADKSEPARTLGSIDDILEGRKARVESQLAALAPHMPRSKQLPVISSCRKCAEFPCSDENRLVYIVWNPTSGEFLVRMGSEKPGIAYKLILDNWDKYARSLGRAAQKQAKKYGLPDPLAPIERTCLQGRRRLSWPVRYLISSLVVVVATSLVHAFSPGLWAWVSEHVTSLVRAVGLP